MISCKMGVFLPMCFLLSLGNMCSKVFHSKRSRPLFYTAENSLESAGVFVENHPHLDMKRFFFLLICVCIAQCIEARAASQDPVVHTPSPPYPPQAQKAVVMGSGECAVEFDATGHVSHATMTQSTWSKMLDENTLTFAASTGPASRIPSWWFLSPISYR